MQILANKKEDNPLLEAINRARREWQNARKNFLNSGSLMTDYYIYSLNASERHYMELLSLAKSEGLRAWPGDLAPPISPQVKADPS